MLTKCILPLGAFDVLEYLTNRGLPDIQIGSPFQMSWFDFFDVRPLSYDLLGNSVKHHADKQKNDLPTETGRHRGFKLACGWCSAAFGSE
jgi:hypothetical protein